MPEYPSSVAELRLRPGERVLWLGRPGGPLWGHMDAFLIPVSIVVLLFALFWTGLDLASDAGIFTLVGLPLVAFGLYITVGRFWAKSKGRQKTLYAVTDQRVIEKSGRVLRSLSLAHLPGMEVTSEGQRGTIVFGSMTLQVGIYANTGLDWLTRAYTVRPLAFFDIPDALGVERTIEEAAAAVRNSGGRSINR